MKKPYFQSLIVLVVVALPALSSAAVPLIEGEDLRLELGGYVQSVSGVQYLTYEVPEPFQDAFPETTGINGEVIRLEWTGEFGDSVVVELHDRLFFQLTTAQQGAGGAGLVGLGASAQPDRSLDLSTPILDENGIFLDHDIDRAAVTVYSEAADITLGRQAITWGRAVLFPVADLWTQFSPFELDQTQKRGTDAARVLVYPDFSTELDFVVADKGSVDDLSGGVRLAKSFDWGDTFVAGGKFWDEIMLMAGVSATKGYFRGRLEVAQPFDLDDSELELPRAVAGGDYISGELTLSLEYLFNGAGADDPADYVDQLSSEVLTRGESYYLGRHYVGGALSYAGFERTSLTLSVISNVGDPSFIVAPNFRYILSDDADINVGAFQGFGEDPEIGLQPEINSEYGTYGGFVFTQLRVFY